MKKLHIILVISFIVFNSNLAFAEDTWRSKLSGLVNRAKVEAKKIEVKVREWANNLFDEKKSEQKQERKVASESPAPTLAEKDSKTSEQIVDASGGKQATDTAVTPSKEIAQVVNDDSTTAKDLSEMAKSLKNGNAISKLEGSKGDATLARNKSGVVVIPVKKNIPLLNIGTEDKITANDILSKNLKFKVLTLTKFNQLPSPDLFNKKETDAVIPKFIDKVGDAKDIVSKIKSEDFPVTKEKIAAVKYEIVQPKEVVEKELRNLSQADLLMISAYLINESGKSCHAVLGLMEDIKDQSHYYPESRYLAGLCAKEMGLGNQFVGDMLTIMKLNDTEFGKLAISKISDEVNYAYEDVVVDSLKKHADKFGAVDGSFDDIKFLYAKVASHNGDFQNALSEAKKVGIRSKYYTRAQFIVFSAQMILGQHKESVETAKTLLSTLAKNGDPHKIEALVHLNMARGYYNNKQYADASQSFLKIKKDHPQWLQGLIEQGWSQLQNNDPSGAIGNMYSIQSNLFASTYKPDSFVVRTIGYINLCQYGDAYRTVELFDRIHKGWTTKIDEYTKVNKSGKKYYETVRAHIKNPAQNIVDGLPMQVVREMARHRDFLNNQTSVNELVDEVDQWSFVETFFTKDFSRINGKIALLKKEIALNQKKLEADKKTKGAAQQLNPMEIAEIKSQLSAMELRQKNLEFRLEVIKQAQSNFKSLKKSGVAQVVAKKDQMRNLAEKALVKRLKLIKEELDEIASNNELLKLEVFSGSGENIRFQAAGGQKGDLQKPKHVKDNSKNMNWEFDGEIWEDEIGNFRSSLENNCPKENAKSAKL